MAQLPLQRGVLVPIVSDVSELLLVDVPGEVVLGEVVLGEVEELDESDDG